MIKTLLTVAYTVCCNDALLETSTQHRHAVVYLSTGATALAKISHVFKWKLSLGPKQAQDYNHYELSHRCQTHSAATDAIEWFAAGWSCCAAGWSVSRHHRLIAPTTNWWHSLVHADRDRQELLAQISVVIGCRQRSARTSHCGQHNRLKQYTVVQYCWSSVQSDSTKDSLCSMISRWQLKQTIVPQCSMTLTNGANPSMCSFHWLLKNPKFLPSALSFTISANSQK